MFIGKQGLPKTEYLTVLDKLTNASFGVMWVTIMFQFISARLSLSEEVDFVVCLACAGFMLAGIAGLMIRLAIDHEREIRSSPELGEY